jgi:hypothetical protein
MMHVGNDSRQKINQAIKITKKLYVRYQQAPGNLVGNVGNPRKITSGKSA